MIRKLKKIIYKLRYILIILSAFLWLLGVSWVFGYTLIENCYCDTLNNCNNSKFACIDLEIWESFTTTDLYNNTYNSTINETINFQTNDNLYYFTRYYYYNWSNRFQNRYYDFFNENWYMNTLHVAYRNESPISTFFYSWLYYCFVQDTTDNQNFYVCWTNKTYRLYTWTVEEAQEMLSNSNVISRRILPYANNWTAIMQVWYCLMLENNTAICTRWFWSNTNWLWYTSQNEYPNHTWISLWYWTDYSLITQEYLQTNFWLSESPFIISWWGWDIITDTWSITNFEAILWYNYTYWFNESYCYWGYPISDIFNSTDNPENFTWFELWSGAYIYDIFDAYSWSYFSSASQFYQSFYSRYLINNIASFYNYPKALYWIVERYAWLYDHYQTYDPNIWISKLVSYCELYKLDPDALYTWGDISAENWYSNLIWEITDKWRYYDSGPLSILSWENIKFWSDEFFTNILNKINTSLDNVSNNAVWVIPRYILVVLVALILFRIISH